MWLSVYKHKILFTMKTPQGNSEKITLTTTEIQGKTLLCSNNHKIENEEEFVFSFPENTFMNVTIVPNEPPYLIHRNL